MSSPAGPPVSAITTSVGLSAEAAGPFAVWQAKFTRAAAQSPGFLSIELTPDAAGSSDWRIVQRFLSAGGLEQWKQSAVRRELLAELAPMRGAGDQGPVDEPASGLDALACVTEVVTTRIEPGKTAAFQAWAESIQASQATFPGYLGTLVQAPLSGGAASWTTLVRFSTPGQLDAWLGSPERRRLLESADPAVSQWRSRRLTSPFAAWFPTDEGAPPSAAWKQTALVLLVLYPVVMLEIRFLSPLLNGQHLAITTFIGNAISVSLVSWPLMQVAVFCMKWWLQPSPAHRRRAEILGVAAMLGLYLIELTAFRLSY